MSFPSLFDFYGDGSPLSPNYIPCPASQRRPKMPLKDMGRKLLTPLPFALNLAADPRA